MTDKEKKNL